VQLTPQAQKKTEIKMGAQTATVVADKGVKITPTKEPREPMKRVKTGKTLRCPLCNKEDTEVLVLGSWQASRLGFRCNEYGFDLQFNTKQAMNKLCEKVGLTADELKVFQDEYADLNMSDSARSRRRRGVKFEGIKSAKSARPRPEQVTPITPIPTPAAQMQTKPKVPKVSRSFLDEMKRKYGVD